MGTKDQTIIKDEVTRFVVKELKEREFERKHTVKPKRRFTLGEEIFHSIILGFGALFSIAAMAIMIALSNTTLEIATLIIYTSSAIILFIMGCLYHSFPSGLTKQVFERIVHAAIYFFIAGIYTPFSLIIIGGTIGWVLFSIQWGLAIIGMTFKSIWVRRYQALHLSFIIVMALSIFYFAPNDLFQSLTTPGFILLISGGLCYIGGLIFFALRKYKFSRTIWYSFVLLGTLLHYLCVIFYVIQ